MVKTGSDRSAKFSAKHDGKVVMLRIKSLQENMKQLFQKPAYEFEIVDTMLERLKLELGLEYGEFGELSDILKSMVWNFDNLSDADFEALHQKLLAKGYTEDEWNIIYDWLEYTKALIDRRYEACHYPTSKLFCVVEAQLEKDAD